MATSKRPRTPENGEETPATLKSGQRPVAARDDNNIAGADFEDEFEDEFESEDEVINGGDSDDDDEIIEAGVDGRPDEERIAEEGVCLPIRF